MGEKYRGSALQGVEATSQKAAVEGEVRKQVSKGVKVHEAPGFRGAEILRSKSPYVEVTALATEFDRDDSAATAALSVKRTYSPDGKDSQGVQDVAEISQTFKFDEDGNLVAIRAVSTLYEGVSDGRRDAVVVSERNLNLNDAGSFEPEKGEYKAEDINLRDRFLKVVRKAKDAHRLYIKGEKSTPDSSEEVREL